MAIFRAVACRASESEETYNLTVEKADDLIANIESMLSAKFNMPSPDTIEQESPLDTCLESFEVDGVVDTNVVQAKGLKRRECTSKGRRRTKGGLELALAKKNKTSSYNASQTPMSIAPQPSSHNASQTPMSVAPQPPPLFSASAPEPSPLFSPKPSIPFSTCVPQVNHFSMSSMYSVHGSYQALFNNASTYDSQASNSPAYSQVLYGHGRGRGRGQGHGNVDHT
ncbi:unnamed protein product [Camellia sinensis]